MSHRAVVMVVAAVMLWQGRSDGEFEEGGYASLLEAVPEPMSRVAW